MKRGIIIAALLAVSLSTSAQVGTITKYISYGSYSNLLGQTVESNVFNFVGGAVVTNVNITYVTVSNVSYAITNILTTNIIYYAITNGLDNVGNTNAPAGQATYSGGSLLIGTNGAGVGVTTIMNTNDSAFSISGANLNVPTNALLPPATTNVLSQLRMDANSNVTWSPVVINYENNIQTIWNWNTNFYYAGIVTQTWTVPFGCSLVRFKAWGGGGGGAAATGLGAAGSEAIRTFSCNAGDVFYFRVASGGYCNTNLTAWPFGSTNYSGGAAGGGGGCTIVSYLDITNEIIFAAGGAGAGYVWTSSGLGGAEIGASGSLAAGLTAAGGGTQIAAGSGGTWNNGVNGSNGSGHTGGAGGYVSARSGGGGGAGWFGGGGGASIAAAGNAQSGAGGSSYCPGGYTTRGNNTADVDWQSNWGSGGNAGTNGAAGGVRVDYFLAP